MYPAVYAPSVHPSAVPPVHPSAIPNVMPQTAPVAQPPQAGPTASTSQPQNAVMPQTVHGHPMPITASSVDPLNPMATQQRQEPQPHPSQAQQQTAAPPAYQYAMNPDGSAPPQTWQTANGIPSQQPHMPAPPHGQPPPGYPRYDYREWPGYVPPPGAAAPHQPPAPGTMVPQPHPEYDYRYGREHEQPQWAPDPAVEYYQVRVIFVTVPLAI